LLKEYDCLSLEVMFYIPALGATVFLSELVGNALHLIFTFHLSSYPLLVNISFGVRESEP
jgi:hypothetical protein